ncbi:patatin-like phospholipase family protein [Oceanospirillum sanctuarii]|uniref:patatin-like phospholipase family protein n=1 Tax=Oceanospirillum sanctuarii TaxID=1434821 RepID=UPI000A38C2D5|nr:patatin-like phospholipase family protein [Oceanospirillum sanctuarii]
MGSDKKRVSLVLGSGGAKGLAHIGVIRWLEENGFEIASVSGSSIGALVGGIYAAGKLGEFERWVRAITKADMVTLMDISWGRGGLIKGDKIINTLTDLVGDKTIEDLPVSFTAVATDIRGEREVWLNSGSLFQAIRASISLPMFFTPVQIDGLTLIDGGVLNPVPIAPTFGDKTDLTIAVNLGARVQEESSTPHKRISVEKDENPDLQNKIARFFKNFQKPEQEREERDWSASEIANQAFDAMQSTLARQKLAVYPPDMVVEIARNACGTLEFNRAAEMIDLGYQRAALCLKALKSVDAKTQGQHVIIPHGHEVY